MVSLNFLNPFASSSKAKFRKTAPINMLAIRLKDTALHDWTAEFLNSSLQTLEHYTILLSNIPQMRPVPVSISAASSSSMSNVLNVLSNGLRREMYDMAALILPGVRERTLFDRVRYRECEDLAIWTAGFCHFATLTLLTVRRTLAILSGVNASLITLSSSTSDSTLSDHAVEDDPDLHDKRFVQNRNHENYNVYTRNVDNAVRAIGDRMAEAHQCIEDVSACVLHLEESLQPRFLNELDDLWHRLCKVVLSTVDEAGTQCAHAEQYGTLSLSSASSGSTSSSSASSPSSLWTGRELLRALLHDANKAKGLERSELDGVQNLIVGMVRWMGGKEPMRLWTARNIGVRESGRMQAMLVQYLVERRVAHFTEMRRARTPPGLRVSRKAKVKFNCDGQEEGRRKAGILYI